MRKELLSKFKEVRTAILWLYMPAVIVMIITVTVSYKFGIPISKFTHDPVEIIGGHPFLGVISNIGVLLWCASAVICFFSFALLNCSEKCSEIMWLILGGGGISAVFLLDDLFLLHEEIFPSYLHINQKIIFLFYGIMFLFYLAKFRRSILKTNFLFLLFATFFLVSSAIIDQLKGYSLPGHNLFEDGSKFFGIVSWFGYYFSVCFQEIREIRSIN